MAGALDAKFAALAARMTAAAPGGSGGGAEGWAGGGLAGLGGAAAARSGSSQGDGPEGGTGAGLGCPLVGIRARMTVVEGSGHAVHLEQPAALARVLAAFLDGVDTHKEA